MVARPGVYQASFNSGELAPELYGRTDIKQFYTGASRMLNCEPVPQGGGRLSPRSRFLGRLRKVLAASTPSTTTITPGPFTVASTLVQLGFASATAVSVIALPGLTFSSASDPGAILQWEWQDGLSAWHSFGPAFSAPSAAKTQTTALAPASSVSTAALRLRMLSAPPASVTYTIASAEVLHETASLAPVRLRPFTFALDQSYAAAITGDVVDFFRDGAWVGCARLALSSDQVKSVDTVQRLDTLLLYHRGLKTKRIMRAGSDSAWLLDDAPFESIPQVDLGGTYSNQVTDKWQLYLSYPTTGTYANGAGLLVSISVNGNQTAGLATGAPDWDAFDAAVKAAIEALPGVGAGITVSHTTQSGLTILEIDFTGLALGSVFVLSASVVNTALAAATVAHTQIGKPGGEALISAGAGYSGCAAFYQDRLISGGFDSKRGAWLASKTADYFALDITDTAKTGAILLNLDTDGAEVIQRIARGRHLLFFTSDAEYFVSTLALDKSQPVTIVNSSRIGSAPNLPVIESEGSILYFAPDREDAERKGKLLYAASFDAITQAYTSDPLSLLASHIVNQAVGFALQKGTTASDANRAWIARADGSMTEGVMIRGQDVIAFVRWQTAGAVLDVMVDGRNRPHIAVQRTVGGAQEVHLERLELGLLFDGTVEQTFSPTTTITGLGMHEGATVWALADGRVQGPLTVASGQITLGFAAAHVLVGRWTAPDTATLPLPSDVADRIVVKRPRRVFAVRTDLIDTTSVAIAANGEAASDYPLYFAGQPTDAPPPPFSGLLAAEGLTGISQDGIVHITQVRPGALQWRSVTIEATMPGRGG